ncbi:MAG: methyltransferase domain-containing protein [Clostridia bacterium]|nr:methyltransferase domain-containing protein [Clostridia bacterium]
MNERYEELGNWDFSNINLIEEHENNWDMYEEIKKNSNEKSLVLDLGTGGGQKVFSKMPKNIGMVIGTDLSPKMIETAQENLIKHPEVKAKFLVMNNLKLEFPDGLFDIVSARHTVINAKEIYRVLNEKGVLILRGVDKYDCWELKELFGGGQCFNDKVAISKQEFEDIKNAGFKKVQLIELKANEYYKTKDDLFALLLKVPILDGFSVKLRNEEILNTNMDLFEKYVKQNTTPKGILLKRVYYGIIATK